MQVWIDVNVYYANSRNIITLSYYKFPVAKIIIIIIIMIIIIIIIIIIIDLY